MFAAIFSISLAAATDAAQLLDATSLKLRQIAEEARADGDRMRMFVAAYGCDHPSIRRAVGEATKHAADDGRAALAHQDRVLDEISELTDTFAAELEARREIAREFAMQSRPPPPFPSTEAALACDAALSRRYRTMRRAWSLPKLIHALRTERPVLRDPRVQRALREVCVDRIAYMVRRTFVRDDSRPLLGLLVREIASNAEDASRRRHPEFYLEHRPRLSVRRPRVGRVEWTFEDFGDPRDFDDAKVLGESHSPTTGLGIGRFNASVLANFMGGEITHETKPNGSGSIVRVSIEEDDRTTLRRDLSSADPKISSSLRATRPKF